MRQTPKRLQALDDFEICHNMSPAELIDHFASLRLYKWLIACGLETVLLTLAGREVQKGLLCFTKLAA
ncbi:hypothetical protein HanXRQr2_Chr04g0150551 [Helianthus annuus]|uniref:Uncharacterized protein n=1 Tax=Helianthus annuus TaxID=4232 RepID=A0A9K3J5T8_HELAN|nr:hypothetical protein HanXRQr2_Chr04g0150551 [Helianthus annuus]KAJ0587290.1 hypothetical protein HanIR_Chr04g0161531 [Helianthus annuus]